MALDISKLGIGGIGIDTVTWLCQNVGRFNASGSTLFHHELMKGKGWKILTFDDSTIIVIDDPLLEMQFKLTWL
jgi:hypothetical protein